MAKFNVTKEREKVTNYMGHKAYKNTPKLELVNAVLSSFIENSYYEKAEKRLTRITALVEKVAVKDPEFVAKLAIFARDQFHMRSSFHAIVGELSKVHRGDNLVARVIEHGVLRPDDLTEIVSYVGKPIPNQVKKGVAKALRKFDKYQLGKYQGAHKEFALKDLVRMVHPVPEQGMLRVYKALAAGQLRNKETWESRLTAGEKKDVVFKELLQERKLGYMATLRNLRSIIQTGDNETVELALKFITNQKAVENSKQLPFRFLSAYEALQNLRTGSHGIAFEKDTINIDTVFAALEQAIGYSVANIPLLTGKTFILADNSGSMGGDSAGSSLVSAYSQRTTANIANLFATLYWTRAENTAVGLFGDRLVTPHLDRDKGVFENYHTISSAALTCGGATEQGIFDAFKQLVNNKQEVDRIVIFSDMQIGKNEWYGLDRYHTEKSTFNALYQQYMKMFPKTMVYSVDLKGYGNTVIGSNVLELSGWSDQIFTVMQLMEQDRNALIHSIEAIEL